MFFNDSIDITTNGAHHFQRIFPLSHPSLVRSQFRISTEIPITSRPLRTGARFYRLQIQLIFAARVFHMHAF